MGRVTRLPYTVGKPRVGKRHSKLLRLDIAIRPQPLAALPRNPDCYTDFPVSEALLRFRDTLGGAEYGLGHGLSGTGEWALYVQGFDTYRHHDVVEAEAWKRAALAHGYVVTLTRRDVR
jgi:hypothetical protein